MRLGTSCPQLTVNGINEKVIQIAWNVIQIAAPRLYPGPVPNVSFPVLNGEPALGSSG